MAEHAARDWVERNFPEYRGGLKAQLMLAYGAGLDAGLAEAGELVELEIQRRLIRDALGLPMSPFLDTGGCPW
jgi:hypothetical protein